MVEWSSTFTQNFFDVVEGMYNMIYWYLFECIWYFCVWDDVIPWKTFMQSSPLVTYVSIA